MFTMSVTLYLISFAICYPYVSYWSFLTTCVLSEIDRLLLSLVVKGVVSNFPKPLDFGEFPK